MKYLFLFLSFGVLFFASCKKIVNVDLKNVSPRVVIEGTITDEPGLLRHKILVSKTSNFSADNKCNAVIGAMVIVTDVTDNKRDTLIEEKPGEYYTKNIKGESGHIYQLNAIVDGISYTSSSTMPDVVKLDSIYVKPFVFFGFTTQQPTPVFTDPVGIKNYYRFSFKLNDSLLNSIESWDDQITDGKLNSRPLNINEQDLFDGNDTLELTMYCTDKANFDFFNTLINASGDGQTPANPTSNISGNALGYFGAVTQRKRTVIVP